MRMWMLDPILMCNKHVLGEHGEIHKHRHNFVKRHRVDGRVLGEIVQIEVASMKERHDLLHIEMESRFNKKYDSPYEMPDISYLSQTIRDKKVDIAFNLRDIADRCPDCAQRIKQYLHK